MTNASPWYIDCVCPICGGETQLLATLPWPQFGHIDFSPFAPGPSEIFGCIVCVAGVNSSPSGTEFAHSFFCYLLSNFVICYIYVVLNIKRKIFQNLPIFLPNELKLGSRIFYS